jgi:malate dehydrogenase (oxaloacetate-decarboxylating)
MSSNAANSSPGITKPSSCSAALALSQDGEGRNPSAGFSITCTLQIENFPGSFSKVAHAIGEQGCSLSQVTLLKSDFKFTVRQLTVLCRSTRHSQEMVELLSNMPNAKLLDFYDDTFEFHKGGKLSIEAKRPIDGPEELARAYTPGVARVCLAIHDKPELAYDLTIRGTTVAVVSDGSAVLGLGNIGPKAAMPVMEGKALLFKQFAGIDAFPICLDSQDTEEIIRTVKLLSPSFGGINLEDISAPRCFEIEERLRRELDIPVFHDDQHGTAVVVLAALINAMKITGKKFADLRVVINGFGASGVACAKIL